jgi:hypothetical protein
MVSIWWLLAAFLGGGWIGIVLFALMSMASKEPRQLTRVVLEPGLDW